MSLSFVNIVDSYAIFFAYDIESDVIALIKQNMDLPSDKEYVFSFGRFVEFDKDLHGSAIKYFFDCASKNIQREVVGEDDQNYQVSYKFANRKVIRENLNKDQMLFLCGIFHNLNLKSYLSALTDILMNDFGLQFDNIKSYAKDDSFSMKIYVK